MNRLDAIVDQLALAMARAHGYRPRQFRSEADWRSWCERDAASEAFEMSDIQRAA